MQVVQTDQDLINTIQFQYLIKGFLCRNRFQQQHYFSSSVNIVAEPLGIVNAFPHGEHHDVGSTLNNLVDFLLATFVHSIRTHQQLSCCQRVLNLVDVV